MKIQFDQKVLSAIGVAAAGALGALAASDTVSPQIAAYCALAVVFLGSLGIHVASVPKTRQEKIVSLYEQSKVEEQKPSKPKENPPSEKPFHLP